MASFDITAIGSPLEFDTGLFEGGNFFQYDSTHIIMAWSGTSQDGYIGVFTLDGTGNITSAATPLEFDTTQGGDPCIEQVDSTHYIVWWKGTDGDGFVQVMTLNTGTWEFTATGTPLEFETLQYTDGASRQVDSNHFLFTWAGDGTDGFAQVFTVNTSTWAVTAEGTALEHDTSRGDQNALVTLDSTHYMALYSGVGTDGYAQVLAVNTSTWAVTEVGTELEFDTNLADNISAVAISSSKVLVFWRGGATTIGYAQVLSVDGSWNITAAGALLNFETVVNAGKNNSVFLLQDNIYINAWGGRDDDGYVQAFEVNLSTWAVTPASPSPYEFDLTQGLWSCGVKISDTRFALAWQGTDNDGFIQAFDVTENATITVTETMANPPRTGLLQTNTNPTHDDINDYYILTTNVNQYADYFYKWDLTAGFTMEVDMQISDTAGADAIWFYWGSSAHPQQEDTSSGIGYLVERNEFSSVIRLRYGGSELDSAAWTDTTSFETLKVVQSGTNIKVYLDDVLTIDYDDISRALPGNFFGWGARCGGTGNIHRIRNLSVVEAELTAIYCSTAYPTIFETSVTSMAVNLPTNILVGDLLVAHVGVRNAGTWTVPSGWVLLEEKAGGGTVGETGVWYKIADGSEGSTATWTAGTSTTAAWQVRKIRNWHGTTPPEYTSANGDFTTAPNPPSLSPSWGAADTLWLALAGSSATVMDFTGAPTNYTDLVSTVASTGGGASNAGSAIRTVNTATEDPGLFTTSQNRWWAAFTVAVRPVGGDPPVGDTPRTNRIMMLGVA